MNQYEAMFLFDPTVGSSFEDCEAQIRRLMERAKAEIIVCRKWEERRLAYKIKGRKRGLYVLVYFKSPPETIAAMERDVQISEDILRVLVVRAEGLTREMMEPAVAVADEAEPASSTAVRSEPASANAAATETPKPEPAPDNEAKEAVAVKTAPADSPGGEAATESDSTGGALEAAT